MRPVDVKKDLEKRMVHGPGPVDASVRLQKSCAKRPSILEASDEGFKVAALPKEPSSV